MPTLFERIDGSLSGNNLLVNLALQADQLGGIGSTIAELIDNPPDSLDDLSQALNELPLPDFQISGSFAAQIASLEAAIPKDLSALNGTLLTHLAELVAMVDTDLAQVLNEVMAAISAIYRLIQIDFRCEESDGGVLVDLRHARSIRFGQSLEPTQIPSPLRSRDLVRADEPPTALGIAIAQVDQILAVLNRAPSPFNVESALDWLHRALTFPIRDTVLPQSVPLFDDLLDPLATVLAWKAMTSNQIRDQMVDSLQDLVTFIRSTVKAVSSSLSADLKAIATQLQADGLARIANDLTASLIQLRSAVNSGNLSGTDAAIAQLNARLSEYEALHPVLQSQLLSQLPALSQRLQNLPEDLDDQINHLLSVLQPNGAIGLIPAVAEAATSPTDILQSEVEANLQPLVDWFQNVTDQLNLTAIKDPLKTVAETLGSAVNGLDRELTTLTLQVRQLFSELESQLQAVDIQALVDQVIDSIQAFTQQLAQQLGTLFQPVKTAIAEVVQTMSEGVDQFNPEAIIDAFREAIQAIAGVLEDPAVGATLDDIRVAMNSVTQQLETLSFTPITDQVVTAIDEVAAALQLIEPALLDTALKLSLQAAIAILPEDLTPITNAILDEFGDLIETGPVPILETVKAQPEKLLDKVRSFKPSDLIGETLSQPFDALLQTLESFKPSQLFNPVQAELTKLKARLRQEANPGELLQVLEPPFNQLLATFDRLQPDTLVAPLEAGIASAIAQILAALPVDEIFAQVDRVVTATEEAITLGQRLSEVLDQLKTLLNGFTNAQPQIESWLDGILAKVEGINDTAILQQRLTDLNVALDETKAATLMQDFDTAVNPLMTALTGLDPQAKITGLVQAYSTFPQQALAALPNSPQKSGLISALNRFNPLDPEFSLPYQALAAYRQTLIESQSQWLTAIAAWDERYHNPNGILAQFRVSNATPTQLRQWVEAALQDQFIQPFKAFLTLLEPLQYSLGSMLSIFQTLIAELQAKVADLLLGPESLTGIRDSLQTLIQRLQEFNLNFLRESLQDLFDNLRGSLTALDPHQLRQALETAFNDMLDTLSLEQVLPTETITQLDGEYAAAIAKLQALDPRQVAQIIQPEFEDTVIPLLEVFDISPLLIALLDRLRSLEAELKAEMDRINESYRNLRSSIPSISIDIDIDIDIDVGVLL